MKKQLLKIGAVCFALTIGFTAVAQEDPLSATFKTTETAPTIDGEIDAIWGGVTANAIERLQPDQTVSMVDGEAPTWKAMWDADNTYILIVVPDDHCFTHEEADVASWLADKPEVYFDVNAEKVEDPAVGPSTAASGHYQFATDFSQAINGSGNGDAPTDHTVALSIDGDDANYIFEYAIPHATMSDVDGNAFAPVEDVTVIGFDITIIDLDEAGAGANEVIGRVNWSNDQNGAGESWVDMTKSGDVEYSSDVVAPDAIVKKAKEADLLVKNVYKVGEALQFKANVDSYEIYTVTGAKIDRASTGLYFVKVNNEIQKFVVK